jgi:hypothetical protein
VESPNLLDFLYQNLGLILAILGLAYVLIKFFRPRKAPSTPGAHLSQTEIGEAEAAGERAREDVQTRFGKYFGGKKP